jgi:hypothetical protein
MEKMRFEGKQGTHFHLINLLDLKSSGEIEQAILREANASVKRSSSVNGRSMTLIFAES